MKVRTATKEMRYKAACRREKVEDARSRGIHRTSDIMIALGMDETESNRRIINLDIKAIEKERLKRTIKSTEAVFLESDATVCYLLSTACASLEKSKTPLNPCGNPKWAELALKCVQERNKMYGCHKEPDTSPQAPPTLDFGEAVRLLRIAGLVAAQEDEREPERIMIGTNPVPVLIHEPRTTAAQEPAPTMTQEKTPPPLDDIKTGA